MDTKLEQLLIFAIGDKKYGIDCKHFIETNYCNSEKVESKAFIALNDKEFSKF